MSNPHGKFCTGDPSIIRAVMDEGVMISMRTLQPIVGQIRRKLNGQKGVDDDGNGYVDDVYGYNLPKTKGI